MKGDIGMGWSSKKDGNKEWLLSKATQNYMTPSLYLCCRLISLDPKPLFFVIKMCASNHRGKDIEMVSCSSVWLY